MIEDTELQAMELEIQSKGFTNYQEYIIHHWNYLEEDQKNLLKSVGICPDMER